MPRVRFAPSPTGSLHVGNALSAVANRRLGDWMLLRIDDTDPARNVPGGEEEIIHDLRWLGLAWDEGPMRQSERQERYREAAAPLGDRFDGITLLRQDGTATYHLASVVDDARQVVRRRPVLAEEGDPVEAVSERRCCLAVAFLALALPHGPFVPGQPQPPEVVNDLLLPARDVPRRVGVVDAKQHPVAQPAVRDGTQGVPDMERAGWAGCETNSGHLRPSLESARWKRPCSPGSRSTAGISLGGGLATRTRSSFRR